MKTFNKKWWLLIVIAAFVITACDKKDLLTFHQNGAATVTLTASKTSVAPAPADSATNVISFSWTSPKYEQDSSLYKFILEIDSTGRNFSKKNDQDCKWYT